MKTKETLLFTLFFLSIGACESQNPPQMVPPSPTAYSLGKYGDIPVGLYTGVPNLDIPIYQLSNRDVSVNVSLSYHGAGVKVDEIASFVGLGWSLDAGGVITRVVKGLPEVLTSNGTFFYPRADIQFYGNSNVSRTQFIADNNLEAASNTGVDPEPDVFYFNFMGRSGKFYFDKTGNTVLEKEEGLDIKWQYVSSGVQKFIIKDEMGKIYEFSNYESTYIYGIGQTPITGWYLSKITSPAGNVINFEYSAPISTQQFVRSYSVNFISVFQNNAGIVSPTNVPYYGVNYSEIRLLKILAENGSIEFNYQNQNRQDYQSFGSGYTNITQQALDEIKIKRADGSLLKKYKLLTSYFEANNSRKYDGPQPENYTCLNYRLRLDGVQEYASDNTSTIPAYTFSYLGDNNPTTDDSYTLPYRLSPSQDHWGYYNQSANAHMLPGRTTSSSIGVPVWYQQFLPSGVDGSVFTTSISGGADREVNVEAIKAAMLKEVRYPTGGYTQFFFEANDYIHYIGGVRISKIISTPVAGPPIEKDYTYLGYCPFNPKDYYFEAYVIANTNYPPSPVVPAQGITLKFGIPLNYTPSGQYLDKFIKITVQPQAILGPGSNVGYYSVSESQPGNGSTRSSFDGPENYRDYIERDYWNEFTIEEQNKLDLLFVSEFIDPNYYNEAPFGYTVTSYLSSVEWPYPETYSNSWKRGVLTSRGTYNSNNVLLKSENLLYFRKLKDVIPGFKVIQIPLQGASNGPGYIYSKYFVPRTLSYLKSSAVVQYDNNGQNPLTTSTEYFYDNDTHFQPTRIETTRSDGKKETVSTVYPLDFANGAGFIDDMKNNHLLAYPIEQVKYLVDGSATTIIAGTVAKYNLGGKGLKEQDLKLETNTPVGLSAFKFSNKAQGVLPPNGSNNSFTADNRYKPLISYHGYDNNGHLLSVSKDNDIKTTYVWGYNNQYPIAQVVNAPVTDVFHTSFEDTEGNSTTGDCKTGKKSRTGSYSKSLTGLTNGQYTLSYWLKSGSNWSLQTNTLTVTSNTYNIAIGGQIDELRFYPVGAQMTTYTYEPLTGLTSQCDPNSRIIYYSYDEFQRLNNIKDQDGNILKKICYNYAGQAGECEPRAWIQSWNKLTTPYTMTLTNTSTGVVTTFSVSPSSSAQQIGPVPLGTYNLSLTPTNGSSTTVQLNYNGITQTGISFTINNLSISADILFTLENIAVPCSFTMSFGYSTPTNSISSSGGTVSFYLVFISSAGMTAGNTYTLATINGSCRPSVTRTINYSSSGRNWTITIYPSGQMTWYLGFGSVPVNPGATVGTSTLNYSL